MESQPGARDEFYYYPDRPKKITPEFVNQEYGKILGQLERAEASDDPTGWIDLYDGWNGLSAYVWSESVRANILFGEDTASDEGKEAERYVREEIIPLTAEPNHRLMEAFLQSRHRETLTEYYGDQLVPKYEAMLVSEHPVNKDLRAKVGGMVANYNSLVASGEVVVGGEKRTLQQARDLIMSSMDPRARRQAYMARKDWFIGKRHKLSELYDQQVKIRDEMAKNLGLDSYIPLAYETRQRQGYGPKDVSQFRSSIKAHIVPLRQEILDRRAEKMGKSSLKPWEGPYDPEMGFDPQTAMPSGVLPLEAQWTGAHQLFAKLSPRLARHFDYMRENNLIDLENRPGKVDGATCWWLYDEKKVFLQCNSTGDPTDAGTLIHEMGHAFQGFESFDIKSGVLQLGTLELAEVYSQGMELLSLPHMDAFFDPELAVKFRQQRLEESINTLCYTSAVDEFQHWVYEHPGASMEEKDETWCKLNDIYLPGIDYSDMKAYQSVRWYEQKHIFGAPFYYIDYGLAEIAALQLARLDEHDHEATLAKYLDLCKLGGTRSFLGALDYAGLDSPFNDDAVKNAASYVAKQLGLR